MEGGLEKSPKLNKREGVENCLKCSKCGVLKKLLNSATFSVENTRNERVNGVANKAL